MAGTALTLSTTEFDRPKVVIDGAEYEMRSDEEMSVAFIRRMQALGKQLQDADAEIEERAEVLKDSVRTVMVNLPDDVIDALTFKQHSMIVLTFSELGKSGRTDGDLPSEQTES